MVPLDICARGWSSTPIVVFYTHSKDSLFKEGWPSHPENRRSLYPGTCNMKKGRLRQKGPQMNEPVEWKATRVTLGDQLTWLAGKSGIWMVCTRKNGDIPLVCWFTRGYIWFPWQKFLNGRIYFLHFVEVSLSASLTVGMLKGSCLLSFIYLASQLVK